MVSDVFNEHGFEVVHIGINTGDEKEAKDAALLLNLLFGFNVNDGKDSVYAGPMIELMKGGGPGTLGHIAVAVDDIKAAISFLESSGYELDHDLVKYNGDGELILVYLKHEIAGFAFHLLQKEK